MIFIGPCPGLPPSSPKLLVIENILSLNSRKPLFMFDLNAQVGDVAWAPYSRYLHIPLQNYNYFTFTIELTLDSEASTTHFISKTIWKQLFAFIIVLYFRRFNTVDSKFHLPMTGFEAQICGVGSNCSNN